MNSQFDLVISLVTIDDNNIYIYSIYIYIYSISGEGYYMHEYISLGIVEIRYNKKSNNVPLTS